MEVQDEQQGQSGRTAQLRTAPVQPPFAYTRASRSDPSGHSMPKLSDYRGSVGSPRTRDNSSGVLSSFQQQAGSSTGNNSQATISLQNSPRLVRMGHRNLSSSGLNGTRGMDEVADLHAPAPPPRRLHRPATFSHRKGWLNIMDAMPLLSLLDPDANLRAPAPPTPGEDGSPTVPPPQPLLKRNSISKGRGRLALGPADSIPATLGVPPSLAKLQDLEQADLEEPDVDPISTFEDPVVPLLAGSRVLRRKFMSQRERDKDGGPSLALHYSGSSRGAGVAGAAGGSGAGPAGPSPFSLSESQAKAAELASELSSIGEEALPGISGGGGGLQKAASVALPLTQQQQQQQNPPMYTIGLEETGKPTSARRQAGPPPVSPSGVGRGGVPNTSGGQVSSGSSSSLAKLGPPPRHSSWLAVRDAVPDLSLLPTLPLLAQQQLPKLSPVPSLSPSSKGSSLNTSAATSPTSYASPGTVRVKPSPHQPASMLPAARGGQHHPHRERPEPMLPGARDRDSGPNGQLSLAPVASAAGGGAGPREMEVVSRRRPTWDNGSGATPGLPASTAATAAAAAAGTSAGAGGATSSTSQAQSHLEGVAGAQALLLDADPGSDSGPPLDDGIPHAARSLLAGGGKFHSHMNPAYGGFPEAFARSSTMPHQRTMGGGYEHSGPELGTGGLWASPASRTSRKLLSSPPHGSEGGPLDGGGTLAARGASWRSRTFSQGSSSSLEAAAKAAIEAEHRGGGKRSHDGGTGGAGGGGHPHAHAHGGTASVLKDLGHSLLQLFRRTSHTSGGDAKCIPGALEELPVRQEGMTRRSVPRSLSGKELQLRAKSRTQKRASDGVGSLSAEASSTSPRNGGGSGSPEAATTVQVRSLPSNPSALTSGSAGAEAAPRMLLPGSAPPRDSPAPARLSSPQALAGPGSAGRPSSTPLQQQQQQPQRPGSSSTNSSPPTTAPNYAALAHTQTNFPIPMGRRLIPKAQASMDGGGARDGRGGVGAQEGGGMATQGLGPGPPTPHSQPLPLPLPQSPGGALLASGPPTPAPPPSASMLSPNTTRRRLLSPVTSLGSSFQQQPPPSPMTPQVPQPVMWTPGSPATGSRGPISPRASSAEYGAAPRHTRMSRGQMTVGTEAGPAIAGLDSPNLPGAF